MLRWALDSYLVDGWSAVHLAVCLTLGLGLRSRLSPRATLLAGLVLGLAWEVLEGLVVCPWLCYHEPFLNAWVSDPAFDLLGLGWACWLSQSWRTPPPRSLLSCP